MSFFFCLLKVYDILYVFSLIFFCSNWVELWWKCAVVHLGTLKRAIKLNLKDKNMVLILKAWKWRALTSPLPSSSPPGGGEPLDEILGWKNTACARTLSPAAHHLSQGSLCSASPPPPGSPYSPPTLDLETEQMQWLQVQVKFSSSAETHPFWDGWIKVAVEADKLPPSVLYFSPVKRFCFFTWII